MNKAACWMDRPSDTTVAVMDARLVPLKTTGHEKDHFTVILTAHRFVVFKRKGTWLFKELQNIPGIVVCFSSNGWKNDQLTIEYLKDHLWLFFLREA